MKLLCGHWSRVSRCLVVAVGFAALSLPALADRCTGTCGDGSTFDKPASACDACRMMQCPRTCKLDGVTSCKWCGTDTSQDHQPSTTNVTVRLGADPKDITAPTETIPMTGTILQRPTNAFDHGDGRTQVDIEIIEMSLSGRSGIVLPGPISMGLSGFSDGLYVDVIAGQQFPSDSLLRLQLQFDTTAGTLTGEIPVNLFTQMQPTDPIAQDNVAEAPVIWGFASGPVPLRNGGGSLVGWIINQDLTIVFAGTVPVPALDSSGLVVLAGLLAVVGATLVVRRFGTA